MKMFLATAMLAALSLPALAQTANDVTASKPWSRAMPISAPNGAVYFELANKGKVADKLVSASSPRAQKAELHTHVDDNGVMRMRAVAGGIAVPAGSTVKFAPGGLHVMLMGLKTPFKTGEKYPLTLNFEKAGPVKVEVVVVDGMPKGSFGD